MEDLTKKKCVPCEGGVPPLKEEEMGEYKNQLKEERKVENNKKIKKEFEFSNFKKSIEFVNKLAEIAESESHHPDIHIFYNTVVAEISTHAIGGFSENDFILAAKIERAL